MPKRELLRLASSMNLSHSFLHLPTEQRETGSQTTATSDCARVMAVLRSLALDRKPKSQFGPPAPPTPFSPEEADDGVDAIPSRAGTQVLRVLTVERKIALNCLPWTLSTLSTETPKSLRLRSSLLILCTWS